VLAALAGNADRAALRAFEEAGRISRSQPGAMRRAFCPLLRARSSTCHVDVGRRSREPALEGQGMEEP
jgi:hypothetical protein